MLAVSAVQNPKIRPVLAVPSGTAATTGGTRSIEPRNTCSAGKFGIVGADIVPNGKPPLFQVSPSLWRPDWTVVRLESPRCIRSGYEHVHIMKNLHVCMSATALDGSKNVHTAVPNNAR